MPTERVTLGRSASAARRELGPTAWAVLETVVAHASETDGVPTAAVSARRVVAELGLGKNTVARAMVRLCNVGMLTAPQPRASRGTFTAGYYVVTVSPDVLGVPASASCAPSRVLSSSRRASHAASVPVEQLALLPE